MKKKCWLFVLAFGFLLPTAMLSGPPDPGSAVLGKVAPEAVGMSGVRLSRIEDAVRAAIEAHEVPGAVVLVARHGRVAYFKAFGQRAILPQPEPMTLDTIFDMASLTKVVATSPSIMLLVEQGRLRLDDKVKRYLPKFTGGGKDAITVRQLMVHYSGLQPDFDLSREWDGYDAALEELWRETTRSEPGKEFVYSDLNFIALGEIVRAITGKSLDVFALENVFEPLGMKTTRFNPPAEWRPRIAPTESRNRSLEYLKGPPKTGDFEQPIRGVVHDPTAWRMGGVAGHAGLFSTARDVALYAQMLLSGGRNRGRYFLGPLTVKAMTNPQSPRASLALRGYGWDIDTSYSVPRGDLFDSGFGHTGFTGTSVWVHPHSGTFVVVLSSRLHPSGKGDAAHLRGVVANIVAGSIISTR
jgi:CubicO group peptidase (beta-lactamase class C family)